MAGNIRRRRRNEKTPRPAGGDGRVRDGERPVYAPVLYLPGGAASRGFLIFEQADRTGGTKVVTDLTPRLIRPILALHDAMKADAGLPPEARGWRPPARLARAIADLDPLLPEPDPQTVRSYISQVRKAIRKAARRARARTVPELFEHRPLLGVRLVTGGLIIVDGSGPKREKE